MFKIIQNNDLFKQVVEDTSNQKKIHQALIEKDFWVCLNLYYFFNHCEYSKYFAFTGGTSLSKTCDCIKRFSEDIDIVLDYHVLGITDEMLNTKGVNARDRLIKKIRLLTDEFITNKIIPLWTDGLKKLLGKDFDFRIVKDGKNLLFYYPNIYETNYVKPYVIVQFTSLASMYPYTKGKVNSYIGQIYPSLFKEKDIDVRVVCFERLFWDKVSILHCESNRPKDKHLLDRSARHYYDLYCMCHYKDIKEKAMINKDKLLTEVIKLRLQFYPYNWAKYGECLTDKVKLIPPKYNLKKFEEDYKHMEVMFFDKHPSFKNIIAYLTKLEKEINK